MGYYTTKKNEGNHILTTKNLQFIQLIKKMEEHVHFYAICGKGYEVLHRPFYNEENILDMMTIDP